ncbi:MAG: winged helix DNA-binding protein [Gammaproteobacteria bacterium]|jgi:predicted MarR family transcription regulator
MTATNSAIVSSAHLAQGTGASLSEVEYGIIIASNAMQNWIVRCMVAAGGPEKITYTDALVLHNVYHRNRAKRLADICFTLNIEDAHTVAYSLRKLQKLDLIQVEKRGKESFYQVSKQGREICERYAEIRQQCLVEALGDICNDNQDLHEVARLLRTLSGLYDQAGRAATSL